MRVEGRLFAAGFAFYTFAAILYGSLTYFFPERSDPSGAADQERATVEWVGTTALVLTAGLAILIAFYVLFTARRIGTRPEDRVDGEIAERAGDYGTFSPHSWWPLPVALGAALVSLGVVFQFWMIFLGIVMTGLAVIGLVFEYYRGAFAH